MADETNEMHEVEVVLADEFGRSLPCLVEQTIPIEERDYLLLIPVDAPIEIFMWQADPDSADEDEVLVDVDEADIDALFQTARAVLAEQDLILHRTALTLTAAGDLPEPSDEDCFTLEVDEGPDSQTEEFQILATFFQDDQEYTLCTPLEPLLFFAREVTEGKIELVSPEEFQQIRSQIEDKLFDVLD
ncbi:MAG: DUF3727 domain-containing protein [Leptolyngbyaceae cyanobacterium SM1_1_3]|nr:DUF3727 domain-containing protein [Leptolyngbyaceae cyanobacterium SM1_1_3]NJM84841.1 DUF3727 domain-containing protein [Leptolyngbyaceae cyanobacterium RM2_2_21]NJN03476.1 DUF3727 domain-containing protein [Leptolyngbyaceae cyanobacterium RM1_1_2]NJO09499.1 DUF3727 domain-containing protein [Leptolyngbyaceae cyanobacterium SL_1_1]